MLKKHERAMGGVVGAYTKDVEHTRPIHPEYAAVLLDEEAPDDAVFTVDTGMCNVWAARYITPNGRRRVIGSFLHGSMANAAAARHRRRAVRGPAGTSSRWPATAGCRCCWASSSPLKVLDLPVKVVVFDNATLGMVRLEMLVDGLPSYATDSPAGRLRRDRVGGRHPVGARRGARRRSGPRLREAFSHDGPALIDLVTDPRALSLPPKITRAQVSGFTAAMSKEVLGGGLGEVMAMARSNLRNVPRP